MNELETMIRIFIYLSFVEYAFSLTVWDFCDNVEGCETILIPILYPMCWNTMQMNYTF
jgi:hypothetical protein